MKVLHIITSLKIGGAEKSLLDSILLYIERGIDVDLLLLNGSDSIFLQNLKHLNICHIYSLGEGTVYNPFFIFRIIFFFKRYDIVHAHLFPTVYWTAMAYMLKSNKVSLVYTEHSTHNRRRNKKWMRFIEKFIYKRYYRIICISEKTKENLASWLDLDKDDKKLCVIHNGINLTKFENTTPISKEKLSIPENSRIILMTARFNIQKDQNTLIKSFAMLKDRNVYLIFAGDGILRKESEDLVRKLGIVDRVIFLGIREDIPELIKASYLCVLSSNWEGFGLVAAEYMASGRPAIVSNVDGLSSVVQGAGLLFEKGDAKDLKEKIELLLDENEKYKEVCRLCSLKSKEFSIEKMIDSYIKLYVDILLKGK